MAKQDYIPKQNAGKSTWASNLKTKIAISGSSIGLSSGDITAVQGASQDIIDANNAIVAAITTKEAAVSAAQTKMRNAEKLIRTHIKRAKTHSAYTQDIGENLGIEGPEHTVDIDNARPELTLSHDPAGMRIDFNLHGDFDGVHIYRQAPGAEFMYLATDTSSPYIDTEMVATGTRYRARFILGDTEVGQLSGEVVV